MPVSLRAFLVLVLGLAVTVCGMSGLLVLVLSALDPEAAQLANDADPFGPPPPLSDLIPIAILCLLIAAGGLFLAFTAARALTKGGRGLLGSDSDATRV